MTRHAQIFFLLYICAIAYLSLFPGEFTLHPRTDGLHWYPIVGRRQIMDTTLNVIFYVPLGIAGVWSFRRKAAGWITAVVIGVSLSALIEWLQLWSPVRYGTLNDLATNSLGVILGATAALFLRAPALSGQLPSGASGVLLIVWFLWHTFPFAPRFSVAQLAEILHPEPWSWVTFVQVLLGATVLGVAIEKAVWRWIAFLAIPAALCLLDHTFSYAAFSAAAIGLLAGAMSRDRAIPTLAWALPAWLAIDELRPFRWRAPVAFEWAPFATWFSAASDHIYAVLFGKLFVAIATIWCLRKRGLSWWLAVGIPAAILAIGETTQRWIEGRTPESTDIVLVLIGGILLNLAGKKRLQSDQLASQREQRQVESL